MTNDQLERFKHWTQIGSSIAIPVILALGGAWVQRTLSEAGLKKDYVQIALSILREAPATQNKDLREWAITVLDRNSPVPIPVALRLQLLSTTAVGFYKGPAKSAEPVCQITPGEDTVK